MPVSLSLLLQWWSMVQHKTWPQSPSLCLFLTGAREMELDIERIGPLMPPFNYAMVLRGVHRSGCVVTGCFALLRLSHGARFFCDRFPRQINFGFLKKLKLRSILYGFLLQTSPHSRSWFTVTHFVIFECALWCVCVLLLRFFMPQADVAPHTDILKFARENNIQKFHCDVGINKVCGIHTMSVTSLPFVWYACSHKKEPFKSVNTGEIIKALHFILGKWLLEL